MSIGCEATLQGDSVNSDILLSIWTLFCQFFVNSDISLTKFYQFGHFSQLGCVNSDTVFL